MIIEKNGEFRNDLIEGLRVKVKLSQPKDSGQTAEEEQKKDVSFRYEGQYGLGYDGCGAHTHSY